jgi:hypothetical protein
MITKRQAQSYYMRAFFKADAQWSKNRRTMTLEQANEIHQATVQIAWDKWGEIITGIKVEVS